MQITSTFKGFNIQSGKAVLTFELDTVNTTRAINLSQLVGEQVLIEVESTQAQIEFTDEDQGEGF